MLTQKQTYRPTKDELKNWLGADSSVTNWLDDQLGKRITSFYTCPLRILARLIESVGKNQAFILVRMGGRLKKFGIDTEKGQLWSQDAGHESVTYYPISLSAHLATPPMTDEEIEEVTFQRDVRFYEGWREPYPCPRAKPNNSFVSTAQQKKRSNRLKQFNSI